MYQLSSGMYRNVSIHTVCYAHVCMSVKVRVILRRKKKIVLTQNEGVEREQSTTRDQQ